MLILAIETSTNTASIALWQTSKDEELSPAQRNIIGELTLNLCGNHSATLMPGIDHLLRETKLHIHQVEGIALGLGPGSFTGLRIGVTTVKGLAYALRVPVVGVSTLDVLAQNVSYAGKLVCPVLDARKNEVYAALYRGDGSGCLTKIGADMVIAPDELSKRIEEEVIFLGNGVEVYREIWQKQLGSKAIFAQPEFSQPRAVHVARLSQPKFHQGQFLDLFSFGPVYLRRSEAEVNWELKKGEVKKQF
ncbi:MAG: tRNA (adenosine(37)-N6)-threonylcarbamoyltransferase complex dimerization subunit type 1 TsaB [Thermodesulfobacteriota bacterium]